MKLKDIIKVLDDFAPERFQESYDNSGLLVGSANDEISGVLISLDCIESVVDEAIEKGLNMIVSHHPIIFSGLKRFNGENYIERTVIKAIKNNIALYSFHTNLDKVPLGVNAKISSLLNLKNTEILEQDFKHSTSDFTVGSGMIGELEAPLSESQFLELVKDRFNAGAVRYTKPLGKEIKKVALCGGSGSFLIEAAKRAKADVFISSDIKYHQFFDADGKVLIVDIGHYEAEICTKELIYEILREKFATFELHFSEINTNPVNYL